MNEKTTLDIKNFFSDPDAVRSFAISQEYFPEETHPHKLSYRGFRTLPIKLIDEDIYSEMETKLKKKFRRPNRDCVLNAWFHYVPSNSEDTHWAYRDLADTPKIAGVIFLNPSYEQEFDFDLHMSRPETGYISNATEDVDEMDKKRFMFGFTIPEEYNKCSMFNQFMYRRYENPYGTSAEDSPLFITFNFKYV